MRRRRSGGDGGASRRGGGPQSAKCLRVGRLAFKVSVATARQASHLPEGLGAPAPGPSLCGGLKAADPDAAELAPVASSRGALRAGVGRRSAFKVREPSLQLADLIADWGGVR